MDKVAIVELPTNLGLRVKPPDKEPGVKKLPLWLRKHGFHSLIRPIMTETLIPPPYRMDLDPQSGVLNADLIADYAKQQADLLTDLLQKKTFPVVLGGDCSILLGNAIALKRNGNYALFYLDGHTDFVMPDQSKTKATGGMVTAFVAGLGPSKLTNLFGLSSYFKEKDIWCVGNREYDEAYERPIKDSQCEYITLASLRTTGIDKCIAAFFDSIDEKQLDGFWIHIDVDVLDDEIMPAVDSRNPGGLSYQEFNRIIYLLLSSPKASGIEITILDPNLDAEGEHTKSFVKNFCQSFNKARIR